MGRKFEELFDPKVISKNLAGTKAVDDKARDVVTRRFDQYDEMRSFVRGGQEINIVDEWDQLYRFYKAIYLKRDHSYDGKAKIFMPAARRAVGVIESEAANALFSREDYFSVNARGTDAENVEMSRLAFSTLKYYSDVESYVSNYEIALKQCLIYGVTFVEDIYIKEKVEGLYRKQSVVAVTDPETGEPLIAPDGTPETREESNIVKVDEDFQSIRIEARDIYRVYIDHRSETPEKEDIIYKDGMTAEELLEMADRGVYNTAAVMALIKTTPTFDAVTGERNSSNVGDGKTFVSAIKDEGDRLDQTSRFKVLRFQGWFTTDNEDKTQKIKEQYWIDVGEDQHVLRVIKNPLLGGFKTITAVNYDTMIGEFYTDGIIEPIRSIQTEINDKENQSIDGLTFDLNAPFEVVKSSGVQAKDIMAARKQANRSLFVREAGSIRKLNFPAPLNHLNSEIARLNATVDSTTGATSLAAGAPTGTQADRSGKALSVLQNQTRSQFSKFVRKFERDLIQRSLQKSWNMIVQFIDDEILIEVNDLDGKSQVKAQNPAEIFGQFNINVSGGSQFLKEREIRDSILEFIAILGTDDRFRAAVDIVPMLQDIAKAMPHNMKQYINPDNLVSQMQNQIDQQNRALEAQMNIGQVQQTEITRLRGEIQQTDRSNAQLPAPEDRVEAVQGARAQ